MDGRTVSPTALLPPSPSQGLAVHPDHFTVAAGAGALVEALAWTLAEAGDGVLVPAPYYPAFINDLKVRAELELLPVPVRGEEGWVPTVGALEAAYAAAAARGVRPRMLLLTNPNNPLGILYPPEALHAMLMWALSHQLHVVSDEVYANSVFDGADEHVSLARVAAAAFAARPGDAALSASLRAHVHIIFGLSKVVNCSNPVIKWTN